MIESLSVLLLSAVACAIVGSFLTLRRLSMLADAISHTVLLGIVLAYFVANNLNSPLLLIGASLFGVITVALIELLGKSKKVKYDDAIGVVFPLLFSIAVILISRFARNVHLDTDVVLIGEVIYASLDMVNVLGFSIPQSALKMGLMLLVNLFFIILFYKELKISTFDREYAIIIGVPVGFLFYLLMTLTSLTAVSAFDAIGSVLVLSFLIAPAASAFLLTKHLSSMIFLSAGFGMLNSAIGFLIAYQIDSSISGMCAVVSMVNFFLVLLFHRDGIITRQILRVKNKRLIKEYSFIIHIANHTRKNEKSEENALSTIPEHFNWRKQEIERVAGSLIRQGIIKVEDEHYLLTHKGALMQRDICKNIGICFDRGKTL